MISWIDMIEVFITTTVVAYLITPLFRKIAFKTGYLDEPRNTKVHAHPTPLLGGLSIYIAFMVGLFITVNVFGSPRLVGIASGSLLLLAVGMIDDKMGMMPELKLLAQFLASMAVVKSGVRIEFLGNYYLNTIFTYLWLVGITNSFNLLDNMNGLSAGIAVIASAFFGIAMWSSGQVEIAAISFAMAGACLGFLKHNFPRANIFMGDSGSLVIGFVLASIAILGSWKTRFLTTSLAMPAVILAYPIFDTTLVTIMRLLEGRSVFQGGRDHSSHRLALLGLRRRGTVLVIYGICITLGLSALLIQRISIRSATAVIVLTAISMVSLGLRLAMVDTGRYGRMKRLKGDEVE